MWSAQGTAPALDNSASASWNVNAVEFVPGSDRAQAPGGAQGQGPTGSAGPAGPMAPLGPMGAMRPGGPMGTGMFMGPSNFCFGKGWPPQPGMGMPHPGMHGPWNPGGKGMPPPDAWQKAAASMNSMSNTRSGPQSGLNAGGKAMPPPDAWQQAAASVNSMSSARSGPGNGLSVGPDGSARDANANQPPTAQVQVPTSFAAIWNVNAGCSEDALLADLAKVDFAPDAVARLEGLASSLGAVFGLAFREKYLAAAVVVGLDGIDPARGIIQDNGERVRLAQFRKDADEPWGESSVPASIQSSMQFAMPKLMPSAENPWW